MSKFPDFITTDANRIVAPPASTMEGYVFEGSDDVQIVFWQCKDGGECAEHVHDFWEYAVVIEGTFDGTIGDKEIHLEPGDSCIIPPGTKHSGRYSSNYRAIDAFSSKRVCRIGDEESLVQS